MSHANQVAVAGPSALADPSRSARNGQHPIPRFLLKLYEIINDPANEELIKWSETGDSFYIYHQERFAREVLGKWFKHQNFSSFVRQLNLYGFRKISALQQGLLRMDHDNETIQFAHPYFHRGQPDLMTLIQRKRHPPAQAHAEDAAAGLLQATQEGNVPGQAVDVRAIVDGIAAIRRQQQAISADLSALKQSNDALWKEAIEARQRHAKHEDTINRILKFLAGLFGRVVQGHEREHLHDDGQAQPRRQMLMIGDGRPSHGDAGSDFGESDFDARTEPGSRPHSPFSMASERFTTIETSGASAKSPAAVHSPESTTKSPPKRPQTFADWSPPKNKAGTDSRPAPPSTSASASAPIPATTAPEQPTSNPEAMWHATFQQMMNAPAQFQRLAQTFANTQQPYPMPGPGPGLGLGMEQAYPADFSNTLQLPPYNSPDASAPVPQQVQPSQQQLTYPGPLTYPAQPAPYAPGPPAPYAPSPGESALLGNTARMQRMYRDKAEIDADIDVLQTSIHSLIRDMGLDPQNPAFPSVPGSAGGPDQGGGEFPFDSWLNQLSGDGAGAAEGLPELAYPGSPAKGGTKPGEGEDFSAFLDIPGFDKTASDASAQPVGPGANASSPTGQKRKLEVVEIPEAAPADAEEPSSKKKR